MEAIITLENIGTPLTPLTTDDECSSPLSHNIQKTQEGRRVEGDTTAESSGTLNQDTDYLAYDGDQSHSAAAFNETLGAKHTLPQSLRR
jgi:hypothetical protein